MEKGFRCPLRSTRRWRARPLHGRERPVAIRYRKRDLKVGIAPCLPDSLGFENLSASFLRGISSHENKT